MIFEFNEQKYFEKVYLKLNLAQSTKQERFAMQQVYVKTCSGLFNRVLSSQPIMALTGQLFSLIGLSPGARIKLFLDKCVEFSRNNLPHIIYSFLNCMVYI